MRNEEEVFHRLNELRGKLLRLKEIMAAGLGSRTTRVELGLVEVSIASLEWVLEKEWQKPVGFRD